MMDLINIGIELKKTKEVIELHDYIFTHREDFVEGRATWSDLSDIAEDFYYRLLELRDLLETIAEDSSNKRETR